MSVSGKETSALVFSGIETSSVKPESEFFHETDTSPIAVGTTPLANCSPLRCGRIAIRL